MYITYNTSFLQCCCCCRCRCSCHCRCRCRCCCCWLKCLFRSRLKKTSKLRVTCLCAGNSSLIGEFPAPKASNAENVSIWWRHHATLKQSAYGGGTKPVFQCMNKLLCVELLRHPKFNTKYHTRILEDDMCILFRCKTLKALWFKSPYAFWNSPWKLCQVTKSIPVKKHYALLGQVTLPLTTFSQVNIIHNLKKIATKAFMLVWYTIWYW